MANSKQQIRPSKYIFRLDKNKFEPDLLITGSERESQLNADQTLEALRATLTGALPFPEIVGQLIANGVEYYHVDFVYKSFTFYSAAGAVSVAPLSFEDLPAVASEFDAQKLRAAIIDSQ